MGLKGGWFAVVSLRSSGSLLFLKLIMIRQPTRAPCGGMYLVRME